MKTIVVIGGGITGLSTAYYLNKMLKSKNVAAKLILIESNERLGGKIKTIQAGEFIMETGADSIVARKETPLIEELNLTDKMVYNATGISYLYIDSQLKPIPEDAVFGIPLSIESLAKSNLVSAEGKVEALKDFYTPNETFTKNDSIGLFLEAFLGSELVERQIAPVLSGVYSGKLSELTIASTLPYLLEYKNQYGSIIHGLSENRKMFKSAGNRKFLSFKNGVSTLIDQLEEQLPEVEIQKGVQAVQIEREEDRYRIKLANREEMEADYIVLSTPHSVAQTLLKNEDLDHYFNELKDSSLISIYIGFSVPDHLLPKDGTGYITADKTSLNCDACTWTSRKWEHTSKNRNLLVRLFYKSSNPIYQTLQAFSEQELLKVALDDIQTSLGISSEPITFNVTKWQDSMPNYHIKHHQIVQSLEEKMNSIYPHILLAGCSYYGVGIPDCIANGEKTAGMVVNNLVGGKMSAGVK